MSAQSVNTDFQTLIAAWLHSNRDYSVVCMDADGAITAWLGASAELFGYQQEEIVGDTLARIYTPEDREKGFHQFELEVAKSQSRSENDRWHVRRDGTHIWMAGTVTAMRDAAGQLMGFVKVMRDRTDARTQLEHSEATVVRLRETRSRTHLFLRTLGHELRNPLSPLGTAVHIIQRLSADARVERALDIITRQIAALTRLADDLMDIARLETGKMELKLQSVDLRRCLSDAVAIARHETAATAKKLSLQALLPDAALRVCIDEARFQRLLLNLLGNAIKYTPEGGTIWVKATQEGPEVVLRVEDTGIGIAPDVLPRIFELFTQERKASDVAPGGLGVGLAMVREIAELHGGSVQARSAGEGKGSEFTVRLPVRPSNGTGA